MDQRDYAEIMSSLADAARLPYYEAKPLLDRLADDVENLPRTRLLSRIIVPGLTNVALSQARHEAQLDLLQVGIALEQYHSRNGEYPPTLETIAPDLGGTVPVDPHTGEPYHYTPQGETFLLYSVGFNLVDDGGQLHLRDGDIVWRGEQKHLIEVAKKSD